MYGGPLVGFPKQLNDDEGCEWLKDGGWWVTGGC